MFCRNDEEKVDCCREKPMIAIICVRAETPNDCTRVVENLSVCTELAQMPSICIGVAETRPDNNIMEGTTHMVQKKWSGL